MSTIDAFVRVPAFHASYVDRSEFGAEASDGERSGESPKGVRSGRSPSLRGTKLLSRISSQTQGTQKSAPNSTELEVRNVAS